MQNEKTTPRAFMKTSPIKLQSPVALALIATLALAIVPDTHAQRYGGPDPAVAPVMDPATGLPMTQPPPWKDPNWKDPDKVLADVYFDSIPLAEVAKSLREQFKDAFDVLIPNTWQNPNNPA